MVVSLFYGLSLLLGVADRITKQLALLYAQELYTINEYLSFELIFNRGVSWSLFHSESNVMFGVVTLVVIGIALALAYYSYTRYQAGQVIIGELLILVGACSNIIDRCLYQGVIDFIVLSIGLWTFPVFNIADVTIIVGVSIMFVTQVRDL